MALEVTTLGCSCAVEHLGETGRVRRQTFKVAQLALGRNEAEDIVLKLSHGDGSLGPFVVREHAVHRRFVKEGKATIRLITQKLHLLLSNCPPDRLSVFLRGLAVKLRARGNRQGATRRMLGDVSLQFTEISPLSEKDVVMAEKNKPAGRGKENLTTPTRTPTSKLAISSLKRKLSDANGGTPGPGGSAAQNPPSKKLALLRSPGAPLSPEQKRVLDLVRNGESIFFTGSAGTGKSYLLRRIIAALPPDTTFPTASTGAAACHIGGTTLHSFAGIGTGKGTLEQCISLASRDKKAAQWRKAACLIIDEISMIDAEFFDRLEAVARAVRKSKLPFGGLQLVLCGDFLQLPPVTAEGEERRYCFQGRAWRGCVTRSMELTEVYRQKDKQFIALLQNIRIGRCTPAISQLLQDTCHQEIESGGIKATKLFTHKEDAAVTNMRELASLGGQPHTFRAEDSDSHYAKQLDSMCPVDSCLHLKVGAQVMLAKNLDVSRGLVNGARGVVTRFDSSSKGCPVVRLTSGLEVTVGYERWSVRVGGGAYVGRRQLPLKLAWAISIHKSQGMTLDCVEISLGRVFEDGQAYVALSRARSLRSLRVKDFNPVCVRAHADVLDFYRGLRRMRRNFIGEQRDL